LRWCINLNFEGHILIDHLSTSNLLPRQRRLVVVGLELFIGAPGILPVLIVRTVLVTLLEVEVGVIILIIVIVVAILIIVVIIIRIGFVLSKLRILLPFVLVLVLPIRLRIIPDPVILDALAHRIHHPTRGTLLTPSTRAPGAPKQPPNILKVPPRTNHRAAVHSTAAVASSIRAAEAVVVRDVGLARAVHVHILLVLVVE
jgi:hypothetical protein